MRKIVLFTMIATYVILGITDICAKDVRQGLAAILLACVQALLFV